ncbi:MAG: L,D-transpeptidase [Muribaculaceae bacterium]|nr:L,D-transpeptidase [Muribaculaceae bacterium]
MRRSYHKYRNIAVCSVLAALVCLTACNGHTSGSDSNYTSADYSAGVQGATAVPDSMPEKMKGDAPAPEEPKLSFASTQQALDYMNASPDAAKYAEGIIPRMAEDELSYATNLLNNKYDKFLIIDKEKMRVGLFDKYGREILSYGIACSRRYGTKHKKADNRTPEGFFSVEGIYDSTDWLFTNDNGYTSPAKGQFGPRFIRIKNPVSYQIGLHGTASPGSIGRRTSHGCIRVTNDNILELVKYVTPGMPVIISPSARDQQVNNNEGYHIAKITMDPYGKYPDAANGLVSTGTGSSSKSHSLSSTPAAPSTHENSETPEAVQSTETTPIPETPSELSPAAQSSPSNPT